MNIARKKPSITAMNLSLLIKYYLSLKRKKPVIDEQSIPNSRQPVQLETDVLRSLNISTIYVENTYSSFIKKLPFQVKIYNQLQLQ